MIAHERLVKAVDGKARLGGVDAARRAVGVTLATLARRLDAPRRQRLREALPGPERDAAWITAPGAGGGVGELLEDVARNLEDTREHARYVTQVVLSTVDEADPELARALREGLPDEFAALFAAPETEPERRHPGTDAPAPLTPEELAAELRRHPRWSGDVHRLTRTVALPADRMPPLVGAVERAARELNHRVRTEHADGSVTFTLRTGSVDAVTSLDIDLAERIDDAVAAVGSGGRPG